MGRLLLLQSMNRGTIEDLTVYTQQTVHLSAVFTNKQTPSFLQLGYSVLLNYFAPARPINKSSRYSAITATFTIELIYSTLPREREREQSQHATITSVFGSRKPRGAATAKKGEIGRMRFSKVIMN